VAPRAAGALMAEPSAYVRGLPKTELHLHLVGSASPATVLELSQRHPDARLPTDLPALQEFFRVRDFAHFIDVYIAVNGLVRTAADVHALIVGAARDAAASNVRYIELTVTAVSHLMVGITADDLADALARAREDALAQHGIVVNWIFDIASEQGVEAAWQAVRFATEVRPPGTVAFGLAGPEIGWPRDLFAPHFRVALDAGLASVVHAGETTGPETVWSALRDLGAARIGHGTSAARDPALLTFLAAQGIPLEVCPTSNLCTRAVRTIADHPLPRMLAAGVPVTLSSDDPGMFDTTLDAEYALVQEAFGLTDAELTEIARAGVRAALCGDDTRARLLAEIDAHAAP
jgi:aminodeoxyfutalosine deaminase